MNSERFSLTQSQLAIWLGQQLKPDVPLYNMTHMFKLESDVDADLFRRSFQILVDSTEALRLVFDQNDGQPFQYILSEYNYDIELEQYSKVEWKKIGQNWIDTRSKLLLSFDKPLFDSVLVKVGADQFFWFLNIHHLATDATSSTLYLKYLSEIYMALNEDPEFNLLSIPSFREFADFEADQVSIHKNSPSRQYWNSKLDLHNTQVSLYGGQNEQNGTESERIIVSLDQNREDAIEKLLSNEDLQTWNKPLTEFIFYTTLLFSFLFKIGGQNRLAIGAPTHNRSRPNFKQTPGMFIEIFPIVGEFGDKDTFLSLFKKIRQEIFEYLKHAQTGVTSPEISGSFQVMLNYIHTKFGTFNGSDVTSQWIHPGHIDPAHLLRCSIYAMDELANTLLLFDLNNAVFDEKLRRLFSIHFLNLLDEVIADTDMPLNSIEIISEEERSWMEARAEYEPYDFTVLDSIVDSSEKFGRQPAIISNSIELTHSELNTLTDHLAARLLKEGARPGDRVGLYFPRSIEYIVSLVAVMKLGATFIPIATNQSAKRIEYMISDANCSFLLSQAAFIDSVTSNAVNKLAVDLSELQDHPKLKFEPIVENRHSDLAYILYTSGSTGRPKGVRINHGALINYMDWAREYYRLKESYRFPFFTSIGFDLTMTSIFLPLMTGGQLVIYDESDTGPDLALLDVIDDNKANAIKLTPSHMALLDTKDLSNSKLKLIIAGGEELSRATANKLMSNFSLPPRLVNEYGPTEATIGCVVHEFDETRHYNSSLPIGRPIKNMDVLVLDKDLKLLPQGVPGELYLAGLGLADGYLNQDDKTQEHFLANPFDPQNVIYKTGDWARWNSKDELEFLGRKDEQIKFRGYRIELADIERNMAEHQDIVQVAVMLLDQPEIQVNNKGSNEDLKQLVAFFTSNRNLSPEELRAFLDLNLPEFMIPTKYVQLDTLPLTVNGKLNKDQLKLIDIPKTASNKSVLLPRNDIEEMIHTIWKDVIGEIPFGVEDSFISLGGHSLTAIRITTRINEELGLQFPLIKIFELPTIAQYANYVEQTLLELMDN